jgi:transcription antitermination factor NusG
VIVRDPGTPSRKTRSHLPNQREASGSSEDEHLKQQGSCYILGPSSIISNETQRIANGLPWFAVQVRCSGESVVSKLLALKGFETYLPTYRVLRRLCDRKKALDCPLFSGYLFCRINPAQRLPVLITPGVAGILGVGKVPVPIPDREIMAIETALKSGLTVRPHPYLREGAKVLITEGPLRNVQGVLLSHKNSYRVIVNVPLLQRALSVELERDWITGSGDSTLRPDAVHAQTATAVCEVIRRADRGGVLQA